MENMSDNDIYINEFQRCLNKYLNGSKFFFNWFFGKGDGYYFIFKKNLKVTNIQFAELLSLIKCYTKRGEDYIGNQLLFLSVVEFNEAIDQFLESYGFQKQTGENKLKNVNSKKNAKLTLQIASNFVDLIKNSIVIDTFYGSCAVFVPMGIQIDIEKICALSGYIHTCGKNIYIRKVSKSNKKYFLKTVKDYINKPKNGINGKNKILFSVYAHEDFSDYDREDAEFLKNGLEDLKIYIEKFYMGKDSLVNVLKELKKNNPNKLIIPNAGNYKVTHEEAKKDKNCLRERTIWFLIDSAIKKGTQEKAADKYYICYEQLYMNNNHLHIFDETKPAWKSSTTIPHTLLGAMINLTLPYCKRNNIKLLDPFVGTGTTLIETFKYKSIIAKCSDNDPFSKLIIADNIDFFSKTKSELLKILEHLNNYLAKDKNKPNKLPAELMNIMPNVKINNKGESDLSDSELEIIKKYEFKNRLVFYILLKVQINSISAVQRESSDWQSAFQSELNKFIQQIKRLINVKKIIENKRNIIEIKETNCCGAIGEYSLFTTIIDDVKQGEYCVNDNKVFNLHSVQNITENEYDIIITDPPYGFNESKDINLLAKLYKMMIKSMILALKKEGGQIVICLPDKSHSGKISPFFTHKEIVIQQFITTAHALNREIVNNVISIPNPQIFKPPYYWESDRALRRVILYFRLKEILS